MTQCSPDAAYDEGYYVQRYVAKRNFGIVEPYLAEIVTRHLAPRAAYRSMRVLDVGCGLGVLVNFMMEQGIECYGTDLSIFATGWSRQVRASATHLPYAEETFDAIISFHLIEHLDTGQIGRFLDECGRILRPGGRLMLVTPNMLSPLRLFMGNRWFFDPTHKTLFTPCKIACLLRMYNFCRITFRFKLSLKSVPRVSGARLGFLRNILLLALGVTPLAYLREVIHVMCEKAS
jgi:2-polyprenyl-3-methyl-5-hydroxy-6-metoxy-1,4-benzoquinol methylase